MTTILAGASALSLTLAALAWALVGLMRVLRLPWPAQLGPVGSADGPQLADIRAELAALKVRVDGLPSLWEAERERAEAANEEAKRRNARARAALSSARRRERDEDDDDDDGEDQPGFEFHAPSGNGGRVHAVSEGVAGDSSADLTRRALAAGWSPFL